MDDIEIVIKISEKEYNEIKENKYGVFSGHIFETIRNGRPLSEPKWIPVTEGLPEEECDCLVTTCRRYNHHKSVETVTCSYYPDMRSKWFPDDGSNAKNVIAWMPSPEPYKESEE